MSTHIAIVAASRSAAGVVVGIGLLAGALLALGVPTTASADVPAETPTPQQVDFFEAHVRPLLAQHCVECHGPSKQQADLRLDSRESLLKGNDSGPAIVVGNADASRVTQVLRHQPDDVQMPPRGRLSDAELAIMDEWINAGAPWPPDRAVSETAPSQTALDWRDPAVARAQHWALKPITRPAIPQVQSQGRVQSPVDAFILARLEQAGQTLSPPAARADVIRRAVLDVWGVPPTLAERDAFSSAADSSAVVNLVNRLLESPLYGQRWARHWLDVARYGDTKGYVFTEDPRYPFAYTYRDWVVDALNADMPYDVFIKNQLAADHLHGPNDPNLAALGFLTVGRRYANNVHDITDDRIDVTTRGLMGMTVSCARCHDHKFDAIPTSDYYALAAVFLSSREPQPLPTFPNPDRAAVAAFEVELANRQAAIQQRRDALRAAVTGELQEQFPVYLRQLSADAAFREAEAANPELRVTLVEPLRNWVALQAQEGRPLFTVWAELVTPPAAEFSARWEAFRLRMSSLAPISAGQRLLNERLSAAAPQQPNDVITVYANLLREARQAWATAVTANAGITHLNDEALEEWRHVAAGSATIVTPELTQASLKPAEIETVQALERAVAQWNVESPGAPLQAMVMVDNDTPQDGTIFLRGNPGRPGNAVPRRFLTVLGGSDATRFTKGSGRLELAEAIVSVGNPLTPRVIVNRIWQHYFGTGLVATASDFGVRGEPPSHPELLDYLASELVASGWSLKHIHRLILSSATYQQSSLDRPEARAADPENRLLWRMPRKRLDFEPLRDSWLFVAGRLDTATGGQPVQDILQPESNRRTLYGIVNRNELPGTLRNFDFADPDTSSPGRPQTTVPQQALFAMNSPFVLAQAKHAAQRVVEQIAAHGAAGEDHARLAANGLYERILARRPTPIEAERMTAFVNGSPTGQLSRLEEAAQILMLTNEFLFVD